MPLNGRNWIEYSSNKRPKCPYCDMDIDIDEYELWYLYNADETHTVECPYCDKEFSVTSNAKWSFDTDEQAGIEEADEFDDGFWIHDPDMGARG